MKKKNLDSPETSLSSPKDDDFSRTLIHEINKELGVRTAWNLSTDDDAPSLIKGWISTGSRQLDYVISNRRNGGVPWGRMVEIFGPPSIGKSHIGYHMAANVQKAGGLVVCIDTENAIPLEKLHTMGVDVSKRFVACDTHCTEEVFQIMESTIVKAKAISAVKDVPFLIIWDSIAASSPKKELEGEYDQSTIGENARVISKGLRKIIGVIGQNNVTLVCTNQIRMKVGVLYGDPMTTPGGLGPNFHSSVRIKLSGGSFLKNGDTPIGIKVKATAIKNKIARPYRSCEFGIVFGKGIVEHEEILNILRRRSEDKSLPPISNGELTYSLEGDGSWKTFTVTTKDGEVVAQKKFQKSTFEGAFSDPEVGRHVEDMLELVMTSQYDFANGGSDE